MGSIKLKASTLSLNRLLGKHITSDLRRQLQQTVALKVANELKKEAGRVLHSFREFEIYSNSIYIENGRVPVVGVGEEGLQLEKAKQSIDLKERFRNSSKVKLTKKGGWYLTIPMRHKTPAAIGGMPWAVYNAIRFGKKLQMAPGSRPAFYDPILKQQVDEYRHKASIYQGIKRIPGASKAKGNYQTMRRVSSNSDPLSWIIKARQERPISKNVFNAINLSKLVRESLNELI